MDIVELSFENYKPFKRRVNVAIKPLTIIIGKNSSGKSALARLPLLLWSGISGVSEAPLALTTEGVDFGASFVDLIHGRNPHGRIGIGAAFSDGNVAHQIWAEVQNVDEYRAQYVSLLEVNRGDGKALRLLCEEVPEDLENILYRSPSLSTPTPLQFRGLMPASEIRETNGNPLDQMILPFTASSLSNITHLGPFRDQPNRYYRYQGASPTSIGVGGQNAAAALGADHHRKTGVLEKVGAWYAEHLGGWQLAVSPSQDTFSIVLKRPAAEADDHGKLEVNLADVGMGMSQVLPIVVERFLQSRRRGPALHIVEQPELHLHPAAHGSLADLYIDAAAETSHRFLIETHSENFLLRIRRRCAEGTLDPANVVMHWVENDGVEARVQTINIDKKGDVDFWPSGVFSEDFAEVGAIRKATRVIP